MKDVHSFSNVGGFMKYSEIIDVERHFKSAFDITSDSTYAITIISEIPMTLQELPWKNLLWLDDRKTINGRPNKKEIMNLMIAMADYEVLTEKEKNSLVSYLLGVRDLDDTHKEEIIFELRNY